MGSICFKSSTQDLMEKPRRSTVEQRLREHLSPSLIQQKLSTNCTDNTPLIPKLDIRKMTDGSQRNGSFIAYNGEHRCSMTSPRRKHLQETDAPIGLTRNYKNLEEIYNLGQDFQSNSLKLSSQVYSNINTTYQQLA